MTSINQINDLLATLPAARGRIRLIDTGRNLILSGLEDRDRYMVSGTAVVERIIREIRNLDSDLWVERNLHPDTLGWLRGLGFQDHNDYWMVRRVSN